jgi:hypothetical protein
MDQVFAFWGWIVSVLSAFGLGYLLRHRQSVRRRQLLRRMRENMHVERDRKRGPPAA